MKREKILKALAVLGLATTLTLTATAFVGCDNDKTHGVIVDPPIIVVDPPEPDKPITEPDDPVDEKPVDEPDDPVIDEPDEPVIDEPDEPVIDEPDNPPDNPPEEEEQLTEAELKENENRIYKYMAKADNSGWETDSRGNPVEVFNKEGVRETINDYLYSGYAGTGITPISAKIGDLENEEQIFTNYDERNEKYQMGYLGDLKYVDNHGNTKRFDVLEISVDLSDYETLDELTNYLSTYKPGNIDITTSYSYSYSNLDREYRSNRTLSEAVKEKLFGDYSDDEIIFEMYAEPYNGGVGYDFGEFKIVPMACVTLKNNKMTLQTDAISSSMFYKGWEKNLLESEVVGTDCLNENGDRVCVINRGTPTPILTIDDNFYDADDEIIITYSLNSLNVQYNLNYNYVEDEEMLYKT